MEDGVDDDDDDDDEEEEEEEEDISFPLEVGVNLIVFETRTD